MDQLNYATDQRAFQSHPAEDFVVINSNSGSVEIEINEWSNQTNQHSAVTLRLHHREARLLAEMLARNADEARDA